MKQNKMAKQKNRISILAEFDAEFIAGRSWLVGVDEAGRGCLAGPVCAGAVAVSAKAYLNPVFLKALESLDDSKKITEKKREEIYSILCNAKNAGEIDFEAGFASVAEIESLNILSATQLAMARAVEALNERLNLHLRKATAPATLFGETALDTSTGFVLIDGKPMKKFPYAHNAIVKGDASSLAIASASIIAKVTRDRYMQELAKKYPRFGFDIHKGYGTAMHLQNLMLFGATDVHRSSFLKKLRSENSKTETQSELF